MISPASVGDVFQKFLKSTVGEFSRQSASGFPFLRASSSALNPRSSRRQRPVPQQNIQELGAPIYFSSHSSVLHNYPALKLLLDPVQWPPLGHRACQMEEVSYEGHAVDRETRCSKNDPQLSVPCNVDELTAMSRGEVSSAELNQTSSKSGKKVFAQAKQVADLRRKLKAQKILAVSRELQHSQRAAIRAWAAECKRARQQHLHEQQLDAVKSKMRTQEHKLQKKLKSLSVDCSTSLARSGFSTQCSPVELHERRLMSLSPCGRRWRMQRLALHYWAAACKQGPEAAFRKGVQQQVQQERNPQLPSISELHEDADTHRPEALKEDGIQEVSADPRSPQLVVSVPPSSDSQAFENHSCGSKSCISDHGWGCLEHKVYSREVLLLHKELACRIARGPPGLASVALPQTSTKFKVVPKRQ